MRSWMTAKARWDQHYGRHATLQVKGRKLSEVAGMLGSMLQRAVFATATRKGKGRLHSAMMISERERPSRFTHRPGGEARRPSWSCSGVREHLVLIRGIRVDGHKAQH